MKNRFSYASDELPSETAKSKVAALDPAIERLLERVRLKARCRMAWLHQLWMEEGQKTRHQGITQTEIATLLDNKDTPEAQAAWVHEDTGLGPLRERLDVLEQAIAGDKASRWAQLSTLFCISDKEADLLQTCLAQRLDPEMSRLFAYLQDSASKNYVTEHLLRRLFEHGPADLWHGESPLRLWHLVSANEMPTPEPAAYVIDPLIADWLLGVPALDARLVGKATIQRPRPPLTGWPVQAGKNFIQRQFNAAPCRSARLIITGPAGSGRRTLAAVISAEFGMSLLTMDSDAIEPDMWRQTYQHAQRQAFLDRTALCWYGDVLLKKEWPRQVISFPVQFVILEPDQGLPVHDSFLDCRLEMPQLSLDERRGLWQRYIPAAGTWPADEFNRLIHQHQVTVGEIARTSQLGAASVQEAREGIRESARYRLGDLAQRMETPFALSDLVTTDTVREVIKDFLFEAGERSTLWEREHLRRMFPQGRSLMALLSGPSGTGKTMAAQIIAAELELDLFRIDLAAVVSKYVGETSRNLERILSRARNMDVVLLFDEADALLGKRTEIKDAHDRFANTDTNYLLQALEMDYQGIALLSTNRKENIDEAFVRRVRYLLEFPRPDAGQRLILWKKLVDELAEPGTLQGKPEPTGGPLEKQLEIIANGIELTGAQIKYAVLAALLAARRDGRPLGIKHILRGVDRELMKEGRVLTERERERLQVNGG